MERSDLLAGAWEIVGRRDVVALLLQEHAHHIQELWIVVDGENMLPLSLASLKILRVLRGWLGAKVLGGLPPLVIGSHVPIPPLLLLERADECPVKGQTSVDLKLRHYTHLRTPALS